jgi:protein SCO1/2
MKTRKDTKRVAMVFLLGLFGLIINTLSGSTSSLAGPPSIQKSSAPETSQSAAQKYFTDVILTNQDGEKLRFYSDLLKGRVVVIHSFFSTCQGSCLPLIRNVHRLQTALGDKIGTEVYLISISVDPMMDTPDQLKQFAKKNGAGPGWFFLSGDKANVDLALGKLGQWVDNKENHLNIFIIGNDRTGLWKKAFGLAKSEELVKVVESVLNDR